MWRRAGWIVCGVVIAAGVVFYWLTRPQRLDPSVMAGVAPGNVAHGEQVFRAGGCAACHASPGTGNGNLLLGGGVELHTPFGVFITPNISPDQTDGIGSWSLTDFANAMKRGLAPDGRQLYPAFPYTSYTRMTPQDVADLFAFINTLAPVKGAQPDSRLRFPYNIRRGIGLWKRLYLRETPVVSLPAGAGTSVRRGRYLVEVLGHCGQCHTARDTFGGLKRDQWLAGAKAVDGKGTVPNITPSGQGLGGWSEQDIAFFLKSGFTPSFDAVGGAMADVQKNMAKLSDADRQAIATYLKRAVTPRATAVTQ